MNMRCRRSTLHLSSFILHPSSLLSDSARLWPPDVLVHLQLHANVQPARRDEVCEFAQICLAPDGRDEHGERASFEMVFLDDAARELPVAAVCDDEFNLVAVGAQALKVRPVVALRLAGR